MNLLTQMEKALFQLREKDRAHMEGTIHQSVGYLNDVGSIDLQKDPKTARQKLLFLLSRTSKREVILFIFILNLIFFD